MNKRARNRLIGVTAIIVILIAAIFFGSNRGGAGPAYYKTVTEIDKQKADLVGTNVTVGGPVVANSWDKKTHPMRFSISDDKDKTSKATLKIVYNGAVPNTFGNDIVAIVTGKLTADGTIEATELQTKCPEKKEKGTSATTVDKLAGATKEIPVGVPLKVTGFVTPGSLVAPNEGPRFSMQTKDGSAKIQVKFDGATPAGFADNAEIVVGGSLDASGILDATSVAIAAK
jgi:cytochrome c-type biogenesis protein CcmE